MHSPIHLGVMNRFSFTLSKDFKNTYKRELLFVFTRFGFASSFCRRNGGRLYASFCLCVVILFAFKCYSLLLNSLNSPLINGDFRALHSSLIVGNGLRNDDEGEE